MSQKRNIPTDSSYPAFDEEHIKRLLSPDRDHKTRDEQRHVFFSIDPACGGDRSKYAMTSCIFQLGEMIVSFFFPPPPYSNILGCDFIIKFLEYTHEFRIFKFEKQRFFANYFESGKEILDHELWLLSEEISSNVDVIF